VLIKRLRADDPFSYYTVIAADLLGERFRVELPSGQEPLLPDWLGEGLVWLDQLTEGGFDDGADAEVERLIDRARGDAAAVMRLAEELIVRGRAGRGINLAFYLREGGASWTLRLAKIVYPFQYQDVFLREAAEDGVDPYLTAAIARQESAFVPDIRSSANAVGLMQLLPETAEKLALLVGPQGFHEELLEVPDVNVHLGTLYLRGLLREHQGDVTRFLAAYNAGPHRVMRWLEFIEAGDPLTFTERIPFAETRDYVKLVQRNVAVYRQLYGGLAVPTTER
jgi:soluble lytic murein transglycosylase